MPPLVSVIIPTYNRLAFLREAVASVRGQTFRDFELIVSDDGSDVGLANGQADGTRAWLEAEGIRAVCGGHTGRPGLVRNRGAEAAQGRYLAFLDSDDLWEPDKLELQAAYFRAHPGVRLCHTRERWVRGGRTVSQIGQRHARRGMIFTDALRKCVIGPSTVMLEAALFREAGGFHPDLEIAEDYELWLRLTARHEVGFLDRPLTVKRGGHPDQLSEKYGHIEYFRIRALEAALERGGWTEAERALLEAELARKCGVYAAGARKRGKEAEAREFEAKAGRQRPAPP